MRKHTKEEGERALSAWPQRVYLGTVMVAPQVYLDIWGTTMVPEKWHEFGSSPRQDEGVQQVGTRCDGVGRAPVRQQSFGFGVSRETDPETKAQADETEAEPYPEIQDDEGLTFTDEEINRWLDEADEAANDEEPGSPSTLPSSRVKTPQKLDNLSNPKRSPRPASRNQSTHLPGTSLPKRYSRVRQQPQASPTPSAPATTSDESSENSTAQSTRSPSRKTRRSTPRKRST